MFSNIWKCSLFLYNDDEVIKLKFEENLREARKQYGYLQEELADKLNVSRQVVSKCTKGAQSGNAAEHRMPCCYRGWQIISMFQLIICLEEENRSRKD